MFSWLRKVAGSGAMLLALSVGVSQARAESILHVAGSPTVTANGSNFDWDYKMLVTASAQVEFGDYFVIRDFYGFTGSMSLPTDWSLTTEAFTAAIAGTDGTTAGFAAGTDTAIDNLRFTYTGTTVLGPGVDLGDFIVQSTSGIRHAGALIAMDHNDNSDPMTAGLTSVNSDSVSVAAAPLPATASIGLCLFGGLALCQGWNVLRRRREALVA